MTTAPTCPRAEEPRAPGPAVPVPGAGDAPPHETAAALASDTATAAPTPATDAAAPPPATDAAEATLQRLLARMQARSDFPALSARVQAIQRMAASEREPLHRLADEILQDVGLTQKLLRLVNSAHFRRDGQAVATITRAVALVGLAGIRNLALSLVLVEHMGDRAHAQRLKHAFARALLAGQLAHELAPTRREAEEAFLAALFQNLGALVAEFYFPDEAQQVRARLVQAQAGAERPDPLLADRTARQVLGLDYDALGTEVARLWALPDTLLQAMRHPAGASPGRHLAPGAEQLRWLGVAANETAVALWTADPRRVPELLAQVAQRHGRALGLEPVGLRQAAESAWRTLAEMAPTLGLQLPRLVLSGGGPASAAAPTPTPTPMAPDAAAVRTPLALLSAGIQDVAAALAAEQAPLHQVMQMVLETIYRALGCRRVVFCLREADGSRLVGRLGLAAGGAGAAAAVQVPLRPPPGPAGPTGLPGQPGRAAAPFPDALSAASLAGDELWAAPFDPADRPWPAWLRADPPGALFALPLRLRGQPLALILAEHDEPVGWDEAERALLRTLRSQALLAFRPGG